MSSHGDTAFVVRAYHVRHGGDTAAAAAADIAQLLATSAHLIDLSTHDRRADVVTLRAFTAEESAG